MFNTLELISLKSTTDDEKLPQALKWVQAHRTNRKMYLKDIPAELADMKWFPKPWRKQIVLKTKDEKGNPDVMWKRSATECAVFSLVMEALNAGDMCIESGELYSDYRDKLVSWKEYEEHLSAYTEQVGLPADPESFVESLKSELEQTAIHTDDSP